MDGNNSHSCLYMNNVTRNQKLYEKGTNYLFCKNLKQSRPFIRNQNKN